MITPEELFDFAESLAKARTSEACARAAVSRAYYSAYHSCVRVIPPEKNTPKSNRGMHRTYLDQLLANRDTTISFVGSTLDKLHAQRVKADYVLDDAFTFGEATKAIDIARRIIAVINTELFPKNQA